MGKDVNKNIEAKADAVLSAAAKQAIVLCAEAFRFGGNWGFIRRDNRDSEGIIEALKTERQNFKVYPVANGYIVVAEKNFLANAVNSVVPNAINGGFVEKANQRADVEKQKFVKFLDSIANGKSNYVRQGNGYVELELGIYSVNDTNLIRLNGKDYPAYKLELMEALNYARYLVNKGKQVYVKAINPADGSVTWGTIEQLAYSGQGVAAMYKAVEISDSNTGAFLTMRIKG